MKLLYFLLLLHRKIKGPTVLTYQLIPLLKYKDKTKQILNGTTEYLTLKSAPEFEREKKWKPPCNMIIGEIYTSSLNSTKPAVADSYCALAKKHDVLIDVSCISGAHSKVSKGGDCFHKIHTLEKGHLD